MSLQVDEGDDPLPHGVIGILPHVPLWIMFLHL